MSYRAEWHGKAVGSNMRLARVTKSSAYQDFKTELTWIFASHKKRGCTFHGNVEVCLLFKIHASRDIDSLIKVTLDALEKARVYVNDKQVRRLTVTRVDKAKGELDGIYVEVKE